MDAMIAWEVKHPQKGLALLLLISMLATAFFSNDVVAGEKRHPSVQTKKVQLFGTIEFRSDLKALPQWLRVLSMAQVQSEEFLACQNSTCSPAARSWQKIVRQSSGKSPMGKLKAVNAFFNRWPYRLDTDAFGVSDYWASPREFMKSSGDCEDYSIAKYFVLKQLGFDAGKMRIVVVKDRIRNIGHAVLAVYIDGTAYILDNLSNLVLPHTKYRHYIPQYSVNGANRWAHIRPIGKQGF